jgi:hypothetical protein
MQREAIDVKIWCLVTRHAEGMRHGRWINRMNRGGRGHGCSSGIILSDGAVQLQTHRQTGDAKGLVLGLEGLSCW